MNALFVSVGTVVCVNAVFVSVGTVVRVNALFVGVGTVVCVNTLFVSVSKVIYTNTVRVSLVYCGFVATVVNRRAVFFSLFYCGYDRLYIQAQYEMRIGRAGYCGGFIAQWLWRLQSDTLSSSPAVAGFLFLLSPRAGWVPMKLL